MPDRLPAQWCSRALTSVPSGCPGAGWTTMPTGLFTTITSPSSYTTSRGMASGRASGSSASGRVTETVSPPTSRTLFPAGLASTVTKPPSMSRAAAERVRPGSWAARKASSRVPADSVVAVRVLASMAALLFVVFIVEPQVVHRAQHGAHHHKAIRQIENRVLKQR